MVLRKQVFSFFNFTVLGAASIGQMRLYGSTDAFCPTRRYATTADMLPIRPLWYRRCGTDPIWCYAQCHSAILRATGQKVNFSRLMREHWASTRRAKARELSTVRTFGGEILRAFVELL
eukprot:1722910-Rhodomonas_salina.1